ncbi:MAG: hypothetical protein NT029_22075 [Armatimonadetes bacterium]|nr:hypothetical protein [Armatimonadota bacterium]
MALMTRMGWLGWTALAVGLGMVATGCAAQPVGFDFRDGGVVAHWQPTNDISRLESTPDGMRITISGADPYTIGPPINLPAGQPLWLNVRARSDEGGALQVFYFRTAPTESAAVRCGLRKGVWQDIRVPLPALGAGYRFRIDPPGVKGGCVVQSLTLTPRRVIAAPRWPVPFEPAPVPGSPSVVSGSVELTHAAGKLGAFTVRVAGKKVAVGLTRPLIGYDTEAGVRWLAFGDKAVTKVRVQDGRIIVTARASDADGAVWTCTQTFAGGRVAGAVEVRTALTASADRRLVYAPMLGLLAGKAGAPRNQGLFCGLEYLERPDRSSSEDDIVGPGSLRRVPDALKVTLPLMAIQNGGAYVGLIWKPAADVAAMFDSPDRTLGSRKHLMALILPGSDGTGRHDGQVLPYEPLQLRSNRPVVMTATILGGAATTVAPAVQKYVEMRGLPAKPRMRTTRGRYLHEAAQGWLSSGVRSGNHWRHAYWPGVTGFAPQPAADAAAYMLRLAGEVSDASLASQLRQTAASAVALVDPASRYASAVSHVRLPAAPLVFGGAVRSAESMRAYAVGQLARLTVDGRLIYRAAPGATDYARTHFSHEANGLVGAVVADALAAAVFSGDRALIGRAVAALRQQSRFDGTVPRGAQTWECPLHTPDILASAHMVRAYALGYELTGDPQMLSRARYWAWTGVPFVYLTPPTREPVGLYGTIAVLGATGWQAPNWMGLPVQWCGLVYSDALYRLARLDPSGPWRKLAEGITVSGMQQSWGTDEPELVGLLPDSFEPRAQTRNAVAINPGTVQANAFQLMDGPPIYDRAVLRRFGGSVHAPGSVRILKDEPTAAEVEVIGWPDKPYWVLLAGTGGGARPVVNGHVADASDMEEGQTSRAVRVRGRVVVALTRSAAVRGR